MEKRQLEDGSWIVTRRGAYIPAKDEAHADEIIEAIITIAQEGANLWERSYSDMMDIIFDTLAREVAKK